uniref:Uncharacterized protein n=1 Tax=Tetranychus urticae TaxID=32264 RepID=T1KS69_TETUR
METTCSSLKFIFGSSRFAPPMKLSEAHTNLLSLGVFPSTTSIILLIHYNSAPSNASKSKLGKGTGKTPKEDKYVWTFDNFIGGAKHLYGNSTELDDAKVLTEEKLAELDVVDYDKAQNDALKRTKNILLVSLVHIVEGPLVGSQQYLRMDCNVRCAEELEGKFDRKKCPLTTVPDLKKRIWAYIEAIDKSLWINGKNGRINFNCPDDKRKEYVEGLTK